MPVGDQAKTARKVLVRKSENDADSRSAGLFGGARRPAPGVAGNSVRTTKYLHNLLTALPKQLFQQFHRAFNIFWLFQCVVVLIPGLAPYSYVTTLGGFAFVLGVTFLKDFYEDYQRLKSDRQANSQPVEVMRNGEFVKVPAWQLLVGDVVRVNANEQFPVDMVALTSSGEDGLCLVETSNLDGERNLKRYFALDATNKLNTPAALDQQLHGDIMIDAPNDKLYNCSGQLRLKTNGADSTALQAEEQVSAVNAKNLCLRGSKLKQTDWMIGVTVYAGMESKIQMNAMEATAKVPAVERALNNYINFLFLLIFLVCIGLTVGTMTMRETKKVHSYLGQPASQAKDLTTFFTYIVLLNAFIPLSLMVTLEVQLYLIISQQSAPF